MKQQFASNPLFLAAGTNIGVPDQGDVLNLLNSHYACQGPALLVAPEHDLLVDLVAQFRRRYVWICRAICGNDPFIGLSAVIDDGPNQLKITIVTASYHTA